jgi:hypothetical protein
MDGRIVHRWYFSDIRPNYGRLLPAGTLLLLGNDLPPECPVPDDGPLTAERRVRSLGGNASLLVEVDWYGKVIWEYRNPMIHHDFVRLENGNTLLAEWVELDVEMERCVRGGRRTRGQTAPMLGDDIFEIDPEGNEIWRARLWELLDPRADAICPLEGRGEWTHLNSLAEDARGRVLFSCRTNSRVGIIDKSSGALIWKYGAPNVFHQHHATWLANGNIQIFDNGMHRHGLPYSRVVEVELETKKTVWQYVAEPPQQFFSGHISGAERLPNGNTLVCEGAAGRLFEITRNGEVVWEWISPFVYHHRGHSVSWVFRGHRYAPDFPGLKGRLLNPAAYADLNRLYGLTSSVA